MVKNKYLTPKFLSEFENKFGRLQDNTYRDDYIKQSKSALLVLDMQEYFVDSKSHAFVPSSELILPQIHRLIATYLKYDYSVYFTRHVNSRENAGMMKEWWNDLIIKSNPLSNIIPELCRYNLPIIEKSQYDAFYGTDLQSRLQSKNIQRVVITGVMTHLCCETTARAAFVRGFEVLFPIDGTATYNESFHTATLLNLSHGFASIVTVNEIIDRINQSTPDE